ncbi:preprotein translocase subunit SecE [candidate division WWE3 bacterium CG_4_9_14_0_2_um_filter_35_11]|uniref:Protein translocase subunit SecE n=1 Tax=candidate division WWE3 bacterium CG_4_9_14_0_2_um_filter_35_11 TaxID=1975077 RepID=A0A2M8EM55_UNCKA|nr:MAG: preprotein translocase subunit SecE [candidate division WWE3 bacterium CG10_big_fil_rev_8_21_14_0_10_35_32]PJC23805.1 MAG: preprotein translocase subunit SecE [candidate division WWE3 bacterium CG_4_9_14_0_2_um_filter_35_11]
MFDPIKFLKETKIELEKVTWPKKAETIRLTQVIIIVTLIVSFYLGLLDYLFSRLVKFLIS